MKTRKHVSGEAFTVPTLQPMATFYSAPFFLAVIAYPDQREKRERFVEALHAFWRRQFIDQRDFRIPTTLQSVFPRMRSRKIDGVVGMCMRRVCHRVRMGSVGWSLFAGTGIRIPYDAPAPNGAIGLELHGLSTLTEAVRQMLDQRNRRGTFTGDRTKTAHNPAIANDMHIWSESLPVLHLAMALFSKVKEFDEGLSFDERLFVLIHDTAWLDTTLSVAEGILPLLSLRIPQFDADRAIRITSLR